MLFPIGDDQVKGGFFPWVSYAFILLCIVVFFMCPLERGDFFCRFGAIPNEIMSGRHISTLVSSIFLHADFMHLLFNMLFMGIFADNVEANISNKSFFVFFLLGGIVAALTHSVVVADSSHAICCTLCEFGCDTGYCEGSVPMVGASGAISAVLGAYLVMFPFSRIRLMFYFFPFRLPAFVFLIFWIFLQLNNGVGVLDGAVSNVAWWAHIGGFAFGFIAGFYFRFQEGFIGLGGRGED